MSDVTGRVTEASSSSNTGLVRASQGAVVKAWKAAGSGFTDKQNADVRYYLYQARKGDFVQLVSTGSDGGFTFQGLADGSYIFTAMQSESYSDASKIVSIEAGGANEPLQLRVRRFASRLDLSLGRTWLDGLVAGFILLGLALFVLYFIAPLPSRVRLAGVMPHVNALSTEITRQQELISANKTPMSINATNVLTSTLEEDSIQTITLFTQLEQEIDYARRRSDALLSVAETRTLTTTLASLKEALLEQDWPTAQGQTDDVHSLLIAPEQLIRQIDPPWKYVAVVMWGLLGVLASLISSYAWFLSQRTFQSERIPQAIALMCIGPVLVLVIYLVLEQLAIQIAFDGGSQITLDLGGSAAVAVVPFVLGFSAWRLAGTARAFGGQVLNRFADGSNTGGS